MSLITINVKSGDVDSKLDKILLKLTKLEKIMSEVQDQINGVTDQLEKVLVEVQTTSAALQAEIAALQETIDNGLTVDLTALRDVAARLDALNPDAVVEVPSE